MLWLPIPHDFPNHVYSTQLLTHKDGQQGNSDIKVNHLDARYIYFNKFSNLHDGKRPRKIFMTKSKSRGKIISISVQFSSVQLLSRVQLFETPWITARQASLSITNSWSSLRLVSIESVMPSSHLILCRPLLLLPPIPPSIRVFSNESALRMRWPKYWSFSFSIIPSKEHPGLISFRMDWLDLLALQGMLKSLLQHHSSKTSVLHSAFFIFFKNLF